MAAPLLSTLLPFRDWVNDQKSITDGKAKRETQYRHVLEAIATKEPKLNKNATPSERRSFVKFCICAWFGVSGTTRVVETSDMPCRQFDPT